MSAPERDDAALQDVLASVQRTIAADDRGWRRVRSWPTAPRRLAAFATVAGLALLVLVATPRPDLPVYPLLRLLAAAGFLAATAVAGVAIVLRPPHLRAPRPIAHVAFAVALLLLPVVGALLPVPHADAAAHPESFAGGGADFVPRAAECLVFGLVVSIPAIGALLILDRRGAPSGVRLVLLAAVGALAGMASLLFHCPIVTAEHQLVGHGAVGLVAAGLLAAVTLVARRVRASAARATRP